MTTMTLADLDALARNEKTGAVTGDALDILNDAYTAAHQWASRAERVEREFNAANPRPLLCRPDIHGDMREMLTYARQTAAQEAEEAYRRWQEGMELLYGDPADGNPPTKWDCPRCGYRQGARVGHLCVG